MNGSTFRYCPLGLLIAGLEEFITQGVLKNTYGGWILPTLVAFVPLLILVRVIGVFLHRVLSEPGALLITYLVAGSIGLMVEWFLIGLTPWKDPDAPVLAVLAFQAGMFSFWAGVAFAPQLLLDTRHLVSKVRKSCLRFLIGGMVLIYGLTFTVPEKARFAVSIVSVLITFLGLNFFYFRYIRVIGNSRFSDSSRRGRGDSDCVELQETSG
jgi:hypothetical protein